MWQHYTIKEILCFVVVTLFIISRIDFTDARIRDERRMWVATPAYPRRRTMDNTTLPPKKPDSFNSSEHGPIPPQSQELTGSTRPTGWGGFWSGLMLMFENLASLTTPEQKVRTCMMIATTYMGAVTDLRRYLSLRYFYENNLEYEVGYMVNEIITKYQRMLEIYYLAQDRYYNYTARSYATVTYMFYMYTNVLEMGTIINHLCNMLHELEEKFKLVPKSGFDDYHTSQKRRGPNGTGELEKAQSAYEKQLQRERKRRARERKKQMKKNLFAGFRPTPPDRKPKYSHNFPKDYGWSIESW